MRDMGGIDSVTDRVCDTNQDDSAFPTILHESEGPSPHDLEPLSFVYETVSESSESTPPPADSERNADHGSFISAVSNLSIQYNLGVIAPALLLLDPSRAEGTNFSPSDALYPRSNEIDSLLKSAVFGGAILGQCTMGLLGDAIGSLGVAMIITNFLALVGTIGCTLAPILGDENPSRVYFILALSRGLLGVGVGGKYPLGSAMRAQSAEAASRTQGKETSDPDEHRAKEVARGFFWQTPGAILPYVLSMTLLLIFGGEHVGVGRAHVFRTKIQYIVLVGIGAIPSIIVLISTCHQVRNNKSQRERKRDHQSDENITAHDNMGWCRCLGYRRGYRRVRPSGPLIAAMRSKSCWRKLAGTGFSWALYDFVYYGTAFNQPEILARVFGDGGDLVSGSWHNALVATMGIPGVICAIRMMEPMGGPKPLQAWGFVSIGLASLLLALLYHNADSMGGFAKWGSFVACCCLIFTLNWGCNVSTYVLPVEMFPKEVRSTFHGWSAGMGKCGAALGSFFFTELNSISVTLTLLVCFVCCLVGICVTHVFIDPPMNDTFSVQKFQNCGSCTTGRSGQDRPRFSKLQIEEE